MSSTRCLSVLALLMLCNCGMVTASSRTTAGGFIAEPKGAPVANSVREHEPTHTEKVYAMREVGRAPVHAPNAARCRHCN